MGDSTVFFLSQPTFQLVLGKLNIHLLEGQLLTTSKNYINTLLIKMLLPQDNCL